jgi:hypothetical protein
MEHVSSVEEKSNTIVSSRMAGSSSAGTLGIGRQGRVARITRDILWEQGRSWWPCCHADRDYLSLFRQSNSVLCKRSTDFWRLAGVRLAGLVAKGLPAGFAPRAGVQ